MLQVQFFGSTPVVSANDAAKTRDRVRTRSTAFVDAAFDDTLLRAIHERLNPLTGQYQRILLVGIGGSSLGAKMLTKALFYDSKPQVTFLDNVSPWLIQNTLDSIDWSNTLCVFQSKSGRTPEVLALYHTLKEHMLENGVALQEHCIITTQADDNPLHREAKSRAIPFFAHPDELGGRFSVLSTPGLILAQLLRIDTLSLVQGAKDFFGNRFLEVNYFDAYLCANFIAAHYASGRKNLITWNYSERLKEFGGWIGQLIAESLGKTEQVGITPLAAVGVTDQHSLLQLFHDGPDDKVYSMIRVLDHQASVRIPDFQGYSADFLAHKSFQELMDAEYLGTLQSLVRRNKPVFEIALPRIDAYTVGQLTALWELVTAILGVHFEVDTFNQPGVESSKIITRELLASNTL